MSQNIEVHQKQKVLAFINDKGGKVAKFSAQAGHKAYAYHPSHTEELDIDYHQESGGAVVRKGAPFDEFLYAVYVSLAPEDKVDVVVCGDHRKVADELMSSPLVQENRCSSIVYTP